MNMKLAKKIVYIFLIAVFFDFNTKTQIVNQVGTNIELSQYDDTNISIDGYLDESVWQGAVKMNHFNNYLPVDGSLADDDAEILIWYSKEAIYFGIRANANPSEVRSTLADRDKLESDDYLMIILDTYNDQRTAYAFGVNPLGQQADGTITDNVPDRKAAMPFRIDKNPDYVFESKGRIVEKGFVVEIKIPFKSLRYSSNEVQNWGFNVLRNVQHSRYLLSLTQAKLGEASFLAQNSLLTNIKNIKANRLFDINPELRNALNRSAESKDFKSQTKDPLGVNLRYGLSSNTVLNATLNPDFSQIEADVAQISYEPRRALYFPEKRPFFLDGIEFFSTPTRLIYTRKIVNPVASSKITGKIGDRNSIGVISAADNYGSSISNMDVAAVNAIRVKRDFSDQNHAGIVYTDKTYNDYSNRVFAIDGKLIYDKKYSFQGQGGFSVTNTTESSGKAAPMWNLSANTSSRKWSSSFTTSAYHSEFDPALGFVSIGDYVSVAGGTRRTFYGSKGSSIEKFNIGYRHTYNWNYDPFINGEKPLDWRSYPTFSFNFKGGWGLNTFIWYESFGFSEKSYQNHYYKDGDSYKPFVGRDAIINLGFMTTLQLPQLDTFSGTIKYGYGKDPNYQEWAPGIIDLIEMKLFWNPSDQLRVNFRLNQQNNKRPKDGTLVTSATVPRLKIEYQLNESLFLRFVGQYNSSYRDSLNDSSKDGDPIYFMNSDGTYYRASKQESNSLQADFLFSYRPTPGTLVFVGYGSSLTEPERYRFSSLERKSDGFFIKLSYLYRL
tara:strand:- start:3669 stop:6002 length:2334 start_codon:yes stop_codon:yes gene_type:complete